MTLWPFQQVECHSLPFTRLFVASRCSLAYCLWVLCAILLVVIPLFATFATDNVWVKESFYRAQPVVAFTNELFLIASGDTVNSAVGWSTQASLQSLLPPEVKVPLVRSSFSDRNHDGIADVLKLSVELPSSGRRNLVLLAVYQVQVQGKVSEELSGLLALDLSSPYLASGVSVHGQLIFRQKLPLFQSVEVRRIYAESPLVVNWTSSWTPENQPLTLEALLGRYAQRNETATLEQLLPASWDYTPSDSFKVHVTMEVPPQLVYYVPMATEVLKFAWMQYLSFLIPTWMILECFKDVVFDQRLVDTFVVPQLPNSKNE